MGIIAADQDIHGPGDLTGSPGCGLQGASGLNHKKQRGQPCFWLSFLWAWILIGQGTLGRIGLDEDFVDMLLTQAYDSVPYQKSPHTALSSF